ncbi:glycosyl transferase family 1 [Flavobacterium arcticum]|uniref:Glycosyl transferase family 1 n=1 Tax=Flavobacterium arcticum TaxID=1784713 RepID=A0A345HDH0_9FLAO|nr:glycosyltransferase family 4 protein [Flavobacterium arcticum]AXG74630.1 glycosyl transferase family 1 [Flavobacterium arcticum]KAF2512246.1 glycosyltransferase family 4 protein [Flavobacterium arcticum]
MKKVLIISYYWPPAGGPGVQRWLKFVKYLPDYGIEPIVYIPENPTYPLLDDSLVNEVNEKVTILKHKITEPYNWASAFSKSSTKKISSGIIPNKKKQSLMQRLMLWVRGNLFIPDARVLWVKPSISYLTDYIQKNNIDTVITTGPPHSLHLIGLGLKKQLNIKWFADFRDPWTTIGYHKELKLSKSAAKKHKELEREVLTTANQIIVTSPTTKKEFEAITDKPVTVITNGYDVEKIEKQPLDEKFTLAHIGSFLSERNPTLLWQAISELINENQDFKKSFQLKFIGAVSQEVLSTITGFELDSYVDNLGYISHTEALVQQRKSQVLLLVEIDSPDTRCIIPGKLFEYMAAERPILAIGPKGADFSTIITTTNTGVFATYTEKEKIKETLLNYFKQYQQGNLKTNAIGLQHYSRKNLTGQLATLLNN